MGITDSIRPFRAFSGAGRYVCVCYAHKDSGPVYDILERLYTDGYNIWYDEGRPSSDTTELQAQMAVSGCEVFVVFISPSSVRGGSNAMRMLEQVRKLKKPIIYATIDCFNMPDGMESYFQGNRMITGDENEVAESLRGVIPVACRGAARREPARFTLADDTLASGAEPEDVPDIDELISRISSDAPLNIVSADTSAAGIPVPPAADGEAAVLSEGTVSDSPEPHPDGNDGAYSEPVIIREEFYENREKPVVIGAGPFENEDELVIVREDSDGEDGPRRTGEKRQPEDDRFRFEFSGDSGLTLAEYTGSDTELVINELRDGYPITGIGDEAFRGRGALRSIRLPSSVTLIGHTAFRDCGKLSEVVLPASLTALGAGAFYGCASLRKLTIPDSVTAIGDMAFRGCASLSRLTIPDSVRIISADAFRDCMLLIIECSENSYPHWFAAHNNIPFRLISDSAMTARLQPIYGDRPHRYASAVNVYGPGSQDLSAVRRSARLIVSDDSEFLGTKTKKLSPVIEPAGDRYAYLCFADEDYPELKDLLDDLLGYNFDLCRSPGLRDGESVKALLKEQIKKCRSFVFFLSGRALQSERVMDAELDLAAKYAAGKILLIRLDQAGIPDVLPQVPGGSIINRMLLSKDELKTALAGKLASSGCGMDSGVQGGSARLTAGDFEFTVQNSGAVITRYSGGKTRLEIPAKLGGYGVVALGNRVFDGNSSITEVSIPQTVTELGVELFKGCRKLKRVLLPSALTKIGYGTFRDCESLKEINLPSTITEIGWHAFAGCRSLSAMAIPIRVTKIENWAFDGCISLGRISIPDHVTKIDVNAFFNCSKRLTILSTRGSYAQKFAQQNGYKWKRVR